jgi:PhnB protein
MLMRYKESPAPSTEPPGMGDKVMHGSLRISGSTVLVSDGHSQGRPKFEGFALSLTVSSETEAERIFAALGEGGQVQMPRDGIRGAVEGGQRRPRQALTVL